MTTLIQTAPNEAKLLGAGQAQTIHNLTRLLYERDGLKSAKLICLGGNEVTLWFNNSDWTVAEELDPQAREIARKYYQIEVTQ